MNESTNASISSPADESPRQRRAWQRVVQHPQGQFGGLFFCLLAGLVYITTLVPGISVGDSVEMQWVPHTLGVLHATGYPLYTLAGWFWSHVIPTGSVAYRMNAFSAIAGAAAVGLSYMLARRITRSILGAAATALALLAAPLLWSQSVVAEVYAMHVLIVVSVLYLLARWSQDRPRSDAWLLAAAAVAGVGLAHHRTILLLAPAALFLLVGEDRAIWRRWRLWLAALALFLGLGLLPYLYILVRFDGDLARTLDVVTGASFWESFVALRPDWPELVPQVLLEQFGWIGVLTGVGGAGWLLARPGRRNLGVALAIYALTQAAFALVYSVSDVFVFLLPVVVVYALWIGAGADAFWAFTARPAVLRKPRLLVGAVLVVAALALLLTRLPGWAAQSAEVTANTEARVQHIRQVAQRLPEPDAALNIEAGIYGAFLYQQAIDGQPLPPAVQVYIPYERVYYDQALAQSAT
ncbi:MAG: DUF2723 domain-containing protein, partial [Chloroflexi bacterium]|nr:DUF2723 domain-containing protein [Chloroflexota bacterium]